MTTSYIARIGWSDNDWTGPSKKDLVHENKTFRNQHGFGHEDWLFDPKKRIDGLQYGFLPAVYNSRNKVVGKGLDLLLYTISPRRERFYVGRLTCCQVLTVDEGAAALAHYATYGWLDDMRRQVLDVGADPNALTGSVWHEVVNVRFRLEDWHRDWRQAALGDYVMGHGHNRYLLNGAHPNALATWSPGGRQTPFTHAELDTARTGPQGGTMAFVHRCIQNKLLLQLQTRFGVDCVWLERDWIDAVVDSGSELAYYEVKAVPNARLAIREAVGQLLEYAHFKPREDGRVPRLVVVGPGDADASIATYLTALRTRTGIELEYMQVDP
jgi:hypothetical protein